MVGTIEEARFEMEECFIATADELFKTTGITPQDIDIVIVTVSAFTAAPSHASVIANHYKMKESVKTFNLSDMGVAADDEAYGSVFVTEDDDGIYGVRLRSSLQNVAAKAVTNNLATLGPKVLPLREQLYYAYNWLCLKLFKMKVEPYIPNFKLAFQLFCIHPGGSAVISGIGKRLKLSEYDLEASRIALFRFGNTASSGVWYEMAYLQAKRRLKVG
ncbi:hypothetical protein SUGI_0910810 [Cryptomeria japonica]|nr:hypothetical protein SUGI_0910810 [Cryptomeria japonica]